MIRLIVMQQFQQAAELILNVRKYRKGVDDNFQKLQTSMVPGSSSSSSSQSKFTKYKEQYESLLSCCNEVDIMVNKLINAMSLSMPHLANSKLWGQEEHSRRLKILVLLGAYETAARSFCDSKKDLASRALSVYQPTGDSLEYVRIMSNIFFGMLVESSEAFLILFLSNNNANTSTITDDSKSSSSTTYESKINNNNNNNKPIQQQLNYDIHTLPLLSPIVLTYLQN